MIADTNYIVDVLNKEENALEKSKDLTEKGRTQNLCTPVIYEVMTGIEYTGSKKERVKFESMVERFVLLPYGEKSARLSGEIHAELLQEGEERGTVDIQVASIALANDETLLTNDSDFEIISEIFGLEMEEY
ncbi:hypothetical protein AKJ66_04370 [candidate division MSBL1 archaeon SCGC-AAA259E22]|uniref:PIN domain-containing protein n=1 Tax=candidate division MSBL1 archaeon SCGC-AAA259E22 TaxID=1698265 RepID=A0A133UDY7_9EURY|nr:hypothetical protein AKJ66_04370 [candidate division MSBL1 archaeon SCGC-AAA259E22]